jgi:hypothetical protein
VRGTAVNNLFLVFNRSLLMRQIPRKGCRGIRGTDYYLQGNDEAVQAE